MKRLAAILLAAWFIALAIVYQPHTHAPPVVAHARLLDPPDQNLPTLAPLATATMLPGAHRR